MLLCIKPAAEQRSLGSLAFSPGFQQLTSRQQGVYAPRSRRDL